MERVEAPARKGRIRYQILVACLPLVVILGAVPVVGLVGRAGSVRDVLTSYLRNGQVDHTEDQLLWNVAQQFIVDSRYDAAMNIDEAYDPTALNLYILSSDPLHYFAGTDCNCAAVDGHTVVCDKRLLQYFSSFLRDADQNRGKKAVEDALIRTPSPDTSFAFGDKTYSFKEVQDLINETGADQLNRIVDEINSRFAYSLLQWIVGHELGHVMLGHTAGPSSPNTPGSRREVGADDYMIRRVAKDPSDATYFWLAISSAIRTLFADEAIREGKVARAAELGTNPATWPDVAITADPNATHPPLLLRAIDLYERLVDEGAVADRTTFGADVRRHVATVAGHPPAMTLCQGRIQPLLEIGLAVISHPVAGGDLVRFDSNQGWEYIKLTENDRADSAFTDALGALGAQNEDTGQAVAEAYRGRAYARFVEGRYEDAVADWRSAVAADPDDSAAWSDGGFGLYETGRYGEAVKWFGHAIEEDDGDAQAYAGLGIAEAALGHAEDAVGHYQRALTLDLRYGSTTWLRFEQRWTGREACVAAGLLALIQHGGGTARGCP